MRRPTDSLETLLEEARRDVPDRRELGRAAEGLRRRLAWTSGGGGSGGGASGDGGLPDRDPSPSGGATHPLWRVSPRWLMGSLVGGAAVAALVVTLRVTAGSSLDPSARSASTPASARQPAGAREGGRMPPARSAAKSRHVMPHSPGTGAEPAPGTLAVRPRPASAERHAQRGPGTRSPKPGGATPDRRTPRRRAPQTSEPSLQSPSGPNPLPPPPSPREVLPAESPAPPPAPPSEATLLERARAALGDDPLRALGHTRRHEESYPDGDLAEEREALAVDALLRLGRRAEARRRAERFFARHPGSIHRLRMEALLAQGHEG